MSITPDLEVASKIQRICEHRRIVIRHRIRSDDRSHFFENNGISIEGITFFSGQKDFPIFPFLTDPPHSRMIILPTQDPEEVWTGNNHSATRAKDAAHFVQKRNGVFHMLQHVECSHGLKGLVGKWNLVSVVNLASLRINARKLDAGFRDVDPMSAKTLIFEGLDNLSNATTNIQKETPWRTVGR